LGMPLNPTENIILNTNNPFVLGKIEKFHIGLKLKVVLFKFYKKK
jgi:hypothetical protein